MDKWTNALTDDNAKKDEWMRLLRTVSNYEKPCLLFFLLIKDDTFPLDQQKVINK